MAATSLSTRWLMILPLFVYCILLHDVSGEGCLVLNGQSQVFQDHNTTVRAGFRNRIHVLSRDLEFSCYGEVTGWAAYTERAGRFNNLTFQVWRPRGDQANVTGCSQTYDLVGSHTFNNVSTDWTKLLNISSVSAAEYGPITVQPGDVVGYYGNFDRSRGGRISIQNDASGNHLSYFTENVDSTRIDATIEASSCSYFTESLPGAPVITATVVIQEAPTQVPSATNTPGTTDLPRQTTTESTAVTHASTSPATTATVAMTSTPELTQTTSVTVATSSTADLTRTTATTLSSQRTTTNSFTTDLSTSSLETTTETGEVQTDGINTSTDILATTDFSTSTSEVGSGSGGTSALTEQSMVTNLDQTSKSNVSTLAAILISSIVAVVITGILVVAMCLAVGKCVSSRAHRYKVRNIELTSWSPKASDGLNSSRDRTDSHIYCEMSEVFPDRKKEFAESFSDLDRVEAFKNLDCSCKIPHYYTPSSATDYEVPVSTLKKNSAGGGSSRLLQADGRALENTYETPMDAKMAFQGRTEVEERERLESDYDVPKLEDNEYVDITSIARESEPQEAQQTSTDSVIYENTSFS